MDTTTRTTSTQSTSMNPSPTNPSERHYVGVDKPKVEIITSEPKHWKGKRYPAWELDDADHLRIDEQPMDKEPGE